MPQAIPDFTRGHWNDIQGYKHIYSDNEAVVAESAAAYTAAHKSVTASKDLWELYRAVAQAREKGDTKAEAKAQKRLDAAKVAARKVISNMLK
jgi:hypothetical protein